MFLQIYLSCPMTLWEVYAAANISLWVMETIGRFYMHLRMS